MSTNKLRAAFCGCSMTFGEGFTVEDRKRYVYDSLVSQHFKFENFNLGIKGAGNYEIFMQAANAARSKKFDLIFVQWTVLNRMWLSPGPDTHLFLNDNKVPDFHYRDLYISPNELTKFKKLLLILNHDYQNLLDLIDWCNFLEIIAKSTNTKIVFINGATRWEEDIITPLDNNLEKSLSNYSKEMLEFDSRPDTEIISYFLKLQKKFAELDTTKWVCLFDCWDKHFIDLVDDGHPGINSQKWVANKIINYIEENNIL